MIDPKLLYPIGQVNRVNITGNGYDPSLKGFAASAPTRLYTLDRFTAGQNIYGDSASYAFDYPDDYLPEAIDDYARFNSQLFEAGELPSILNVSRYNCQNR